MVASIEETADRYSIPKPFIGLILLPIVVSPPSFSFLTTRLPITNYLLKFDGSVQANAAEHVTSIWMAMKNKMELTIGICVGSSIVRRCFVSTVTYKVLTDGHGIRYICSKLLLLSSRFWLLLDG